jgi:putative salt-induced outer membrane protein YdiY
MISAILLLGALPTEAQPNPPLAIEPQPPLASFVAEDAPPPVMDRWTGSVTIGATYQSGNTDSRAVNANALAEYRREKDRWTAGGFWDYGETKDQTTGDYVLNARKAGASVKYDYFLSKKVYVNATAAIESDTLADLQRRLFFGVGLGYQWREDEKLKWNSELGVGYFIEDRYVDEDKEYIAGRAMNNVEWTISDKNSLANTVTAYPSLEEADDFYGRSDTRFKTTLTEKMFAQLQWVWDYDNTPSAGKDRNDHKVTLGVGWSF